MKTLNIIMILAMMVIAPSLMAQDQIILGNWKYANSFLETSSAGNVKKQNNSDVKFNQKLTTNLNKIGFRSGSTITFKDDGTFFQRVNGRSYNGTYNCASDFKKLTLDFGDGKVCDIELEYQPLEMVFTIPGAQYINLVNVIDNANNAAGKSYVESLVTQYQDTKIKMKFTRTSVPKAPQKQ